MSYTMTYSGLSTPITGAHIHSATSTSATATGPESITIVGTPASTTAANARAGTVTGTATVPAALVTSMNNGQTYISIKTSRFPAGEIGGTIRKQ
ncbi:hypothetical protein GCM10023189_12650 [Nibrella saemangeumensis]|uniref:CHRD domain-containing protein n=2 Tax=Nibrella saemangeumensis TaxID=1084526 RepID=A0ABP8MM88_9BACT